MQERITGRRLATEEADYERRARVLRGQVQRMVGAEARRDAGAEGKVRRAGVENNCLSVEGVRAL